MTDRLAFLPGGRPESTCPRCHPLWNHSSGFAPTGSATWVGSLANGSKALVRYSYRLC